MSPVVATPPSVKPNAHPPSTPTHSYGTRIRSNSVIRPSARLRQSPDPPPPRKIKPAPVAKAKLPAIASEHDARLDLPLFPPPNVMLHSDDMNSRVFLAVGRALMSVNNCAMTIKDLADLCMKYGLSCQNSSAAGQAITTYIRNHLQRCDAQQDHPLLLRHTMSGTLSDDELVSALHSRVGGAHCMINVAENRVTNFRRGTVVWYLSRAAGAPCPFTRAGITLTDYNENGKVGAEVNPGRERKRERDRLRRAEQCGQKRKRLVRACADRRDSDSDSSEDEQRPPKVKLTLRLKPSPAAAGDASRCASPSGSAIASSPDLIDLSQEEGDESDEMSVSSSDSEDEDEEEEEQADDEREPWPNPTYSRYTPPLPSSSEASGSSSKLDSSRRSFSMPYSATSGSPPPDSEDEDDDFHISMTGIRRSASSRSRHDSDYLLEDDDEFDSDFMSARDVDMETHWEESPGPRSPSAQVEESPIVKSEPRDVQGLLDAWDDLDLAVTDRKVVDVVAQAAAGLDSRSATSKDSRLWSWQSFADESEHDLPYIWDHGLSPHMKEEMNPTLAVDAMLEFEHLGAVESPLSPYSSYSAATSPRDFVPDEPTDSRHLSFDDVQVLSPGSVQPNEIAAIQSSTPHSELDASGPTSVHNVLQSIVPSAASSDHPAHPRYPDQSHATPVSQPLSPQLLLSAQNFIPSAGSRALKADTIASDGVVVHPSESCVPAICATEYEGVPVYQMTSGSFLHLRRIDTNYVNISHIQAFLGVSVSTSEVRSSVVVSQGSPMVCGIWVPAGVARQLIPDQPLVNAFLSDDLDQQFPPALDGIRHSGSESHHEFGRPFLSTIEAKLVSLSSYRSDLPLRDSATSWEAGKDLPWDLEIYLMSIHPPFVLSAVRATSTSLPTSDLVAETPLSPTEEEMFRTLCAVPDWEPVVESGLPACQAWPQSAAVTEEVEKGTNQERKEPVCETPLRRSKRVSTAAVTTIATRSRTRSNKRGSRSSLS